MTNISEVASKSIEQTKKEVDNMAEGESNNGNNTKMPPANVDVIGILPSKFQAGVSQPNSLKGDLFAEETEQATLSEEIKNKPTIMQFSKLTEAMTRQLKLLYIKSFINGQVAKYSLMNELC